MNPYDTLFGGYVFVYFSFHKVPFLPSVRLVALAENKPQHNQWIFLRIFPVLILSVVPSLVHILCSPKNIYVCDQIILVDNTITVY